jgi:soluble lytic murein transglycosylase-like protein
MVAGSELAAERFAQWGPRPDTNPVSDASVAAIDARLRMPVARASSARQVFAAVGMARATASTRGEESLQVAGREALLDNRIDDAVAIVDMLERSIRQELGDAIERGASGNPPGDAERDAMQRLRQAQLLRAHIEASRDNWQASADLLEQLDGKTPVDDVVTWERARALEQLEQHAEAAKLYGKVASDESSRLQLKAWAREGHALFAAQDFKAAQRALRRVNDKLDEYPRRHVSLFQEAVALEKLGKLQAAADAYQTTWFEYPYRKEGDDALAALDRLEAQAVVPSNMPSGRQLYSRYRQLRINKHWDVARRLLIELKKDYATESGHSAFEHDIEFQLALNAYHSRAFEEAAERMESLVAAYDAGNRAGISDYLVNKYLSRTDDALGQHEKALVALDRMGRSSGERTRLLNRAEYFEDHGRWEEAWAIYDKLYSAGAKRGWHFAWILYKTNRFDEAFERLSALAERSGGETRAKYLYWSARTLENAGKQVEAKEVFREIVDTRPTSYYGLQARNRILDIEQREKLEGTFVASTQDVAESAEAVLDALEEARDQVDPVSTAAAMDPREAPRAAEWGARELSVSLTEPGPSCIMSHGDIENACVPSVTVANASTTVGFSQVPVKEQAFSRTDTDEETIAELDALNPSEPALFVKPGKLGTERKRLRWTTAGRIYWGGRLDSAADFAAWRDGRIPGPIPDSPRAYDETSYDGGLGRAADEAGELFPELVRAHWLWLAGYDAHARTAARDVAIEFRGLKRKWMPSRTPHELDEKKWDYWIDNRRSGRNGFWGIGSDELRYPVPESNKARAALLARQREIISRRKELEPLVTDALKEVGDYFMVRKLTLAKGGWFRADPAGSKRGDWMQAYPRAFPRLILEHAERNGVNPYLLWALMTVESSFNPDSISTADALGLLQVIPRTGLKTALMLEDNDFGPKDLLEAETAIAHGAFYFSKLVKKFRGQELLAFAGYNGGPHRVGDWIDARGHTMTMDEFVETIPFTQARLYAKKVLRFTALFLRIYEETDRIYVGQNLRVDYLPHPKF